MTDAALIVLRGNSGSGKTTVARAVQSRFGYAQCAVVSQDRIRRELLREPDVAGGVNIELVESIASFCLARGLVTIVEGIFNAGRYGAMLERLAGAAPRSLFYAWDLSFDETVRRHDTRPQREDFTAEEMAEWYHGWQPLPFVEEVRFDASVLLDEAVARVLRDLAGS